MKKLIILLAALLVTTASYPLTNSLNVDHFNEWFTAYKKNYFVTGFSNTPFGNQGKFQISVKTRVLTKDIYGTNLFFAYTQQSFYDYLSPDNTGNPVYESSYMPEVFLRKTMLNPKNPVKYMDIGLRHHSNGQEKSGIDRNWGNRMFLNIKIKPIDYFSINYEIWGNPLSGEALNEDLDDYLGYQKVVFSLTSDDFYSMGRVTFYLKTQLGLRKGLSPPYELAIEIEPFVKYFLPSIYLQWYNGYAESLRFYNKKRNMFRIGFSYPIDDLR